MSKYPEEIEAGKGRVKDCSKMYQGRAVTLKTAYGEVILTSSNIDTLRAQAHLLMPVGFELDEKMVQDVSIFSSKKVTKAH